MAFLIFPCQCVLKFSESDPIEWPSNYLSGIDNNSLAGTWASGLSWQPKAWAFRIHLATGFRAPNVDDFAKFRERNGFIQVPNPDLDAEQSGVFLNVAHIDVLLLP